MTRGALAHSEAGGAYTVTRSFLCMELSSGDRVETETG